MTNWMRDIGDWTKRNASTILSCVGAVGVIATSIFTAEAVREADHHERNFYETHLNREMTRKEAFQLLVVPYIRPAACGIATIVCIFGANALNRKQQAALISAYAALETAFEDYRRKAKTILGEGTDRMIEDSIRQEKQDEDNGNPPWDEVQTFYLDPYGKFFDRTMEEVMKAEYHINRNLSLRGCVTFNEFLSFLGLDPVDGGDEIGWDDYVGEALYGYRWIDFDHHHRMTDDGMCVCDIEMPFPPHYFDEDVADGRVSAN